MNYQKIFVLIIFLATLAFAFFILYKTHSQTTLTDSSANSINYDSINYSYRVSEGKNFSLVTMRGVLGPRIDDASGSVSYEFLVNSGEEKWVPFVIDLGNTEDMLGTYESVFLENGTTVSNSVHLPVKDIISSLPLGAEVQIHAMTDSIEDVRNVCMVESCKVLIESAEKNKASNLDGFIERVLSGGWTSETPEKSLRITFIAETI